MNLYNISPRNEDKNKKTTQPMKKQEDMENGGQRGGKHEPVLQILTKLSFTHRYHTVPTRTHIHATQYTPTHYIC